MQREHKENTKLYTFFDKLCFTVQVVVLVICTIVMGICHISVISVIYISDIYKIPNSHNMW